MIRFRRNKRRHQLTITIDLLQAKKFLNTSFTALLLIIGIGGITYVGLPLFSQQPIAASSQLQNTQQAVPMPTGMNRSVPTQLTIPAIGVSTSLIQTGKNPDGSLAVPSRYDVGAWYEYSPTPGEIGPSVIVGHVDNYLGPAVFFSLRDLKPGDTISVLRQDNSTVTFTVDRVALFDQDNFPTDDVYGNIDHAGLRLITCGGIFNPLSGNYLQNTVVYASQMAPAMKDS